MANKQHNLISLDDIKANPTVTAYIQKADDNLGVLGFTEHGFRHNNLVADTAYRILTELGYSSREAELAAIAGYLHDIGNVVERIHHYSAGALMQWTF